MFNMNTSLYFEKYATLNEECGNLGKFHKEVINLNEKAYIIVK